MFVSKKRYNELLDMEYQVRRNKLIPLARKYADENVVPSAEPPEKGEKRAAWGAMWNRLFFDRMTVLAVRAGVQTTSSLRPEKLDSLVGIP